MKKMYLVVAASMIATIGFSQVRFGAQVIGNAGYASIKSNDVSGLENSMRIGAGAGIVADYSIGKNFGVRGSLNFLQKNNKVEYKNPLVPGKVYSVTSQLNYLELPINFMYKLPLNNVQLYVGAGPSFGYGISGKLKAIGWAIEGDQFPEIIELKETIHAFKKESDNGAEMKRFEISANAVIGAQFNNGIFVNAGYTLGLNNIAKEDSYKNRGIQLTVGFLLPGKK